MIPLNFFAEKIKAYTDSLSEMEQGQRDVELNSLKEVVTNLASNQASNQASTSELVPLTNEMKSINININKNVLKKSVSLFDHIEEGEVDLNDLSSQRIRLPSQTDDADGYYHSYLYK